MFRAKLSFPAGEYSNVIFIRIPKLSVIPCVKLNSNCIWNATIAKASTSRAERYGTVILQHKGESVSSSSRA